MQLLGIHNVMIHTIVSAKLLVLTAWIKATKSGKVHDRHSVKTVFKAMQHETMNTIIL